MRVGRVGLDWVGPEFGAGEVLGPWVGQECWVVGEAGVCGVGWGDC